MNIESLSLADNLKQVVNEVSPGYLRPESITALLEFCSSFPIITSQDIGIEIKLSPVDYKADVAFSIEKNSAGIASLLSESIKRASDGTAGWQIVKEVLQKWYSDENINQIIKKLWLEFDHDTDGYNPVPSLFVELEEGISAKKFDSYSSFVNQDLSKINNLFNAAEIASQEESLKKYLSAFDYTSPVYEIGKMLSRKNKGLRIIFADFGIISVKELLEKLGFTGDIKRAVQLYNDVKKMFDYLILHTNWQENTGYFAIECYFNNKSSLDKEPRWLEVIEYLNLNFNVNEETITQMLHYPGIINTDRSYPFTIIKRFNHIKIIIKDESIAEVKAYLGVRADYKY